MVAFEIFKVGGDDELSAPVWAVDFLLPNGILITHTVNKEASLSAIKEELWKKAPEYPLHAKLMSKNSYYFTGINILAERLELEDETVRLCDANLFQPMLKLEEKKKDNEANKLKVTIGTLIGKGLHEFDALKSVEVSNFREDKKKMCERIVKDRDSQDWLQRVMCLYPPDIDDNDLPPQLISKLVDGKINIKILCENATASFVFSWHYNTTPEQMLHTILGRLANKLGGQSQRDDGSYNVDLYCLKVVGRQEYLLGDNPVYKYRYIRKCLAIDSVAHVAQLILVLKGNILEGEPPKLHGRSGNQKHYPIVPQVPTRLPDKPRQTKSLWNFDERERFQLVLQGVSNVALPNFSRVKIRACLYHGLELTGGVVNSSDQPLQEGFVDWKDSGLMEFELPLVDLPRMSRLCFMLFLQIDKRKEKKQNTLGGRVIKEGRLELRPIAWVNVPVFDFQGDLHTGSQTLYMWLLTGDDCLHETALNPIGTVECNPNIDEAVQLRFDLSKYNTDMPIVFPALETVIEVAADNTEAIKPVDHVKPSYHNDMGPQGRGMINSTIFTVNEEMKEYLRKYIDQDPLCDLTEDDKVVIWKLRQECLEYFPHSLPRVLSCVMWEDHIQVALMQALLQIWRPYLPPEVALELLDFRYPDREVRKYAVQCLQALSDSDLLLYLLQLVQVLKYEPYLECDLVNFLLKRALNNQHIGHYMFWMLRSEMYVSSVSVRFGLILEAYCYGNKNLLKGLSKQVEGLQKLQLLNESVKHMSKEKLGSKEVVEEMRKLLNNNAFMDALSNINSPLDPSRVLGTPRVDKCHVKDSKMKPMWMVWSNQDAMGDMQSILFKKGDDLRQDMMTLQILRIMDTIWRKEGLDLRLNAYKCLSTGQDEGMIGVVTEASTIATIQKGKSGATKLGSAFSKTCLYEWLKNSNPDPASLENALEEFTLSCAGYCVATYILGIGDRHSDNILLRKNGQLVHIDFGHILGHFKSKMGFKRERVPFVLTSDFVYLIQRGPEKNNHDMNRFKQLCLKAYMALRKRSHFLITLFMMMMNTGIPEISSLRDIEFLRKTLVPHYSDQEARVHWTRQYSDALKNSMWASVNFAFHNIARDNK